MQVAQILYALPDASVRTAASALGVPGHDAMHVLLLIHILATTPEITVERLREVCAPGEVDAVIRDQSSR